MTGCVYFIRCGEFVKIGRAASLKDRLRALQGANPTKLEVLLTLSISDDDLRVRMETELHHIFGPLRTQGEWFKYEGPLVTFIADPGSAKMAYNFIRWRHDARGALAAAVRRHADSAQLTRDLDATWKNEDLLDNL